MTLATPRMDALHAVIGADGSLLSADPPILALQLGAGGALGGPLVVPQLAAVARLARDMNVAISRPVMAAGEGVDIDLWVRAQPGGDATVALDILDWHERPGRGPRASAELDAMAPEGGWTWQADTQMRLITLDRIGPGPHGGIALPPPGTRLSAYFALVADAEGRMPILEALAERLPFDGQMAKVQGIEDVLLSGAPVFDVAGRLIGYRGTADPAALHAPFGEAEEAADTPVVAPLSYSALFGRRLDRALRQPLGRIVANADTISGQLEGPLREDYAAYAADIGSAGRHLMELVDDLADLQAIDRPDFSVAREELDMADIARRTAGLLAVKAADKAIRIDAPASDEILPATGEFRRALQVMVNLVGNALRYSPGGSMVWIRLERAGSMAQVVVADQGRGIALADQERIFEKFERLGRDEAGGSGLGLYISRRLARAMDGDIRVESAPGQGARFLFTLPLAGANDDVG